MSDESAPSPFMDVPERTYGPYRTHHLLATTRMSTLFLARGGDAASEEVVIKVLHPRLTSDHRSVARFRDESAAGVALRHPNVIETLARGREGDERWVAFEYLEGVTLADLMRQCTTEQTLTPEHWAWIGARVAEGLHALHELRTPTGEPLELLHADVSPRNVFITIEGEVKVIDLGLVRRAGVAAATAHPSGTLAYLAPERVLGGLVDRRADLFSLGIILYEATTLRRLFKGSTDTETLDRIRAHRLPPPHRVVADYPRRLEGLLLQTLRGDPVDRIATAAELSVALDRFASDAAPSIDFVATLAQWVQSRQ